MKEYETYTARADAEAALAIAGVTSPFTIEVRFVGGLTPAQQAAFSQAADRWTRVIVGDLPSVMVEGEIIDDVLIFAEGASIDGVNGMLGQAGPTRLRPPTAGEAAFLPARGVMKFDSADLQRMEQNGTLNDVITHEMGHVLGIGTVWARKGLLQGAGGPDPVFTGPAASEEYGRLRGTGPTPVPVANVGAVGTRDAHWRELVFNNELMSGIITGAGNPLSLVTVASLQDLGYVVDVNAAEPFTLPSLLDLAESGALTAHDIPIDGGIMLPNIPTVLPASSLQ
jgi:hypothetical protein